MELLLLRRGFWQQATMGELFLPSGKVFTQEQPWRDNDRETSCIPVGRYELATLRSDMLGTVIHVRGVRKRNGVIIHDDTTKHGTDGAILVGTYYLMGGMEAQMHEKADAFTAVVAAVSAPGTHWLKVENYIERR